MDLLGKKTIFGIFILLILVYGVFRTQSFREGPEIFLNNPGFISTSEDLYQFRFETKNVEELTINGKKIFLDTEGNIDHKILLFDGLNEVEIRYYDKYKKEGFEKIMIFKN